MVEQIERGPLVTAEELAERGGCGGSILREKLGELMIGPEEQPVLSDPELGTRLEEAIIRHESACIPCREPEAERGKDYRLW